MLENDLAQQTFEVTVEFNTIYFVDGLPSRDAGSGRRIREDVSALARQHDCPFKEAKVCSKQSFFDQLRIVEQNVQMGALPLIIIDMHGGEAGDLVVGDCEPESISAQEVNDALSRINKLTSNNLVILSAACWGLNLIKPLSVQDAAPFYALIASKDPVCFHDAESGVPGFIGDILENGNISSARATHLPGFKQFLSEEMLFRALKIYVAKACRGRGKRDRLEGLITTLKEQGWPDGMSITDARSFMKEELTKETTQQLVDRYVNTFLASRKPGFDIDTILNSLD